MPSRPGPTIPDGSLGDGGPAWTTEPARMTRPSLAQGRPSAVRTAGAGPLTLVAGGCALLLVLGGIAAVVLWIATGGTFDPDPPRPHARPRPTATALPQGRRSP
jgi:hypothetical protein